MEDKKKLELTFFFALSCLSELEKTVNYLD